MKESVQCTACGRRQTTRRVLIALTALLFADWSLNAHVFPLYDTILPAMREVCTLSSGALLLAGALTASRRPRMLDGRAIAATAAGCACAGSVAVLLSAQNPHTVLMAVGACVLSLSEGCCMMLVGMALVSLERKRMVPVVVSAQAASSLASLVCPVGFSPLWFAMHGACLLLVSIAALPLAVPLIARLARDMPPHDASLTQPASFLPFGHQVFVCLFLFRVVYGFMLTFGENAGVPADSPALLAASLITAVVYRIRPAWITTDGIFIAAALCALAGLLYTPLSSVVPPAITVSLAGAGVGLFELFNWIVLAALARKNIHGSMTVFAWGCALNSVGVVLGANAGRFVNESWVDHRQLAAFAIMNIVLAGTAYAAVFLRGFSFERTISSLQESAPLVTHLEAAGRGDPVLSLDDACAVVEQRFGLTKREGEVLGLLARGRSGVFVQNELCVSYNTVKSHVKHIYQKTGVHAHQELIDLVEANRK